MFWQHCTAGDSIGAGWTWWASQRSQQLRLFLADVCLRRLHGNPCGARTELGFPASFISRLALVGTQPVTHTAFCGRTRSIQSAHQEHSVGALRHHVGSQKGLVSSLARGRWEEWFLLCRPLHTVWLICSGGFSRSAAADGWQAGCYWGLGSVEVPTTFRRADHLPPLTQETWSFHPSGSHCFSGRHCHTSWKVPWFL